MTKRFGAMALLSGALAVACSAPTRAQVTTEDPASVLVFPKVIADGTRDTFLQVSNTSNSMVYASCHYVNGQRSFPDQPPGPANPPLWEEIEFVISLTAQQPTNWLASAGREPNPIDPNCTRSSGDCYGAGTDPGRVPSLPAGFIGELTCIEVDAVLDPISGNHLTGEATIEDLATGDFSKYGAIGLAGLENNNGDRELVLGGEYAACPDSWVLLHATDGSEVTGAGAGSSLRTDLTIASCDQDFQNQVPGAAILQFFIVNEFEQQFSTTQPMSCWLDRALGDLNLIFTFPALGTPTAETRIRVTPGSSGVLVVAEEFRSTSSPDVAVASAAGNAHAEGMRVDPDLIVLP